MADSTILRPNAETRRKRTGFHPLLLHGRGSMHPALSRYRARLNCLGSELAGRYGCAISRHPSRTRFDRTQRTNRAGAPAGPAARGSTNCCRDKIEMRPPPARVRAFARQRQCGGHTRQARRRGLPAARHGSMSGSRHGSSSVDGEAPPAAKTENISPLQTKVRIEIFAV